MRLEEHRARAEKLLGHHRVEVRAAASGSSWTGLRSPLSSVKAEDVGNLDQLRLAIRNQGMPLEVPDRADSLESARGIAYHWHSTRPSANRVAVPDRLTQGMPVPTYQYSCTECGHFFEAVQSFSDDSLTVCPECRGRLRKVYNAVGVVFKGSGFYRTDSRTSSSTGASSSSESSTTETKSATKSESKPAAAAAAAD